jgi:hypothetical protein
MGSKKLHVRRLLSAFSEAVSMRKTARSVQTNDSGHVVGQDHHRAKLTDHDIWLIHELRAAGVKRADIADKMEVSVYTVIEILSGRRRAQIAVGQKPVKPRRT